MTKRGLYKLITKPHIFIRDYIKKKRYKFEYLIPKKSYYSNNKYSVISAVYNVGKYLDDYFKSLTNQTLDFREHIFLILVDDGSTDNSAEIIKKWQKRYPKNITYIKKQNGGQASARNIGLDYVKSEWVTFIDPDDFIDFRYFENIDRFIDKNRAYNFALLSTNFIFFYEKSESFKDRHPLRFRFKVNRVLPIEEMEKNIQLSVNSAFFKYRVIRDNIIRFDERIKPSFEDAHFVGKYLLHNFNSGKYIAFIKGAKYFYRKREAQDSTLDRSWQNTGTFRDVLEYGCLALLKEYSSKLGYVPISIQNSILYHLIWHFKYIIDNNSAVNFLFDKTRYFDLLVEIFRYIELETIDEFNFAGNWFFYKIGMAGLLKQEEFNFQILYIEKYDSIKDEILIRYFSYFKNPISFYLDGRDGLYSHKKIKIYKFLDKTFVYENIFWLPLKGASSLKVEISGKQIRVSILKKQLKSWVDLIKLRKLFNQSNLNLSKSKLPLSIRFERRLYFNLYFNKIFRDAWLFIDRDIQADDNAEHLYRYIKGNYPNINAFFILRRESHDWNRLERDGFRLIPFGSILHKSLFLNAKYLISSHADNYIVNFLPNRYFRDLINFKYIFLQHGVTQNDISKWLNSKDISLFITTSKREYISICGDFTKYKFTTKEVALTGFPRHDKLLENIGGRERVILIMPTWREYLVGKVLGKGNIREKNLNFFNSDYAKGWKDLLNSTKIRDISCRYNYKVVFFPHINIHPYLEGFDIPDYIEVLTHADISIQDIFKRASIMVTDYSSVAFEMAILKRGIIYYQFDYSDIYGGKHFIEKGYFDYRRDGFGDVCSTLDELLNSLEYLLIREGKPKDKYLTRIESFFEFFDRENSKRVFNAIMDLERIE